MEEAILRLLSRRDYSPSDFDQLRTRLGLAPGDEPALKKALAALEQDGQIIRTKGNRYIQSREADLIPGILRVNRQGKGFLDPDDPKLPEIIVPESATSTALNGDRVLVRRDVARGQRLLAGRNRQARWSASWSANARKSSARCGAAANFLLSFRMIPGFRMIFM